MTDKIEALKKDTKKKKQTALKAHLFEKVSEDKAAGTVTLRELSLPQLSTKGSTKTKNIVLGIEEAASRGECFSVHQTFMIFYSNNDPFGLKEEVKFVAAKRS